MAPKSAYIILVSNPFEPLKDTETHTIRFERGWRKRPITVWQWLKKTYPGFKEFVKPTICLFNGRPILRKQWHRRIKPADIINFVTVTSLPAVAWWIIAAVVVASVAVALIMKVPSNLTGDTPAADPAYTLRGQHNQIKLGQPIECAYGKTRNWMSYAAPKYVQYIDNKQWLFQLFSLGHGKRVIHSIMIGNTAIEDFQNVSYEVVTAGSPVTLFPTNVTTVSEVSGIELLGTNESNGWVVDSEGYDSGDIHIAATGHTGALASGPFVVNAAGTLASRIEVDLTLPRGLYLQANDGTLGSLTVTALFEVRTIDGSGTPTGAWTTLQSWTTTHATVTPQRFTIGADVTPGRYQIRGSRTNAKNLTTKAGDGLIWESTRAFIPSSNIFPVDVLAVKAQATNNLNDSSAAEFNVDSTRCLKYWDPTLSGGAGAWSATEVATRSPAWAFADAFRAQYGGRMADTYLDTTALVALDLVCADRAEFFDWQFEQRTTCWDVARVIASVMRGVPMLNGSRITCIRDDVKTFPIAIFNTENIVKGTFKRSIKLAGSDEFNGLRATYIDPITWKEATVLCCLDDEEGDYPEEVKLTGITGRAHAYHIGMYLRRLARHANMNIEFATGMEGHIPSYGDMVSVAYDVPRWSQGGILLGPIATPTFVGGASLAVTLTLSEPIQGTIDANSRMLFRKRDNSVLGPKTVTAGTTADQVIVSFTATEWSNFFFDNIRERAGYIFGTASFLGKNVRITMLSPAERDTVGIKGIPYDDRYFADENRLPPAEGDVHGGLPSLVALPAVDGLRVVPAPVDTIDGGLNVCASWFAMRDAKTYRVEYSYDAKAWNLVIETQDLSIQFPVTYRYLFVRVAAINAAQGEWAYWTGNAPVQNTAIALAPSYLVLTSSGEGILQPDGTTFPRMKVAWTVTSDILVQASGKTRIQYKKSADTSWNDWGTVQGAQTFDYITDVLIGVAYSVRIRSENKFGGISGWVTPAGGTHVVVGDITAPAAVASLTAAAGTGKAISLTWPANTEARLGEYGVYRYPTNDPASAVKIAEVRANRFVDTSVTLGTQFYYWVTSISWSEVESAKSNAATATTSAIVAGDLDSAITTAISAAASAASAAQTAANTANNALADIASDNILSPVEKPSVVQDYSVITTEQTGIDSSATQYGITTEKSAYDAAVTALTSYLGTLTTPVAWNTLTGNTTIVGTTFRSKFSDVYTTRQTLLDKITKTLDPTAPDAPGAATLQSSGFTLSGDGTVFSKLELNIPAMPAKAQLINVLFRKTGTTGWIVADQWTAERTDSPRRSTIDDLIPGGSYDVALQSFGLLTGSALVAATGSPFTAPNKNTAPNAPTSLALSTENVPAAFYGSPKIRIGGSRVTWVASTSTDVARYEVKGVLTNDSASTTYTWYMSDSNVGIGRTTSNTCVMYAAGDTYGPLFAGHCFVRAVDRSGNASTWAYAGYLNGTYTMGSGTVALQDASDVSFSGVKVGAAGAASIRQIVAEYHETKVVNLSGGTSETFAVDLTSRGFTTAPEDGHIGCDYPQAELDCVYDFSNGSNSSTAAYIYVKKPDGSSFGAGNRRFSIQLVQYA